MNDISAAGLAASSKKIETLKQLVDDLSGLHALICDSVGEETVTLVTQYKTTTTQILKLAEQL